MIEKKSKLLKKGKYSPTPVYGRNENKKEKEVFPEQAKEDKRGPLENDKVDESWQDVRSNYSWLLATALLMFGLLAPQMGCKPRTATQKIEDKVEDVGHEINQGAERAKENVNDATK